MSYLVLARKYRPRTFAEVAGQEIVLNTLRGAIESGRIGHAYLFTGPRGTGKTTTARLLAKALNCEKGPTPEPCGECARCRGLEQGGESDIIEIDAASNTSVEDVRVLRDQAAYMPLAARFKIFLIDEVHMLSKAAFNALLKILEEPPEHVKFLFATTEPHKVLDTILSRCQVLKLSLLPEERIVHRLEQVFAAEHIDAEAGVLDEIARRARGGMRDALSIADQLLAMVGDKPRLADIERLAGEGQGGGMAHVVALILAADKPALLQALPPIEGSEGDWLSEFLAYLRATLLATLCGPEAPMLEGLALDDGARAGLVTSGKAIGGERLEVWLQELLHARERMRLLPSHARLVLEVTLLDLCQAGETVPLDEWIARLESLEQGLPVGSPAPAKATPSPAIGSRPSAQAFHAPQPVAAPVATPAPQDLPARDIQPQAKAPAKPAARSQAKPPAKPPAKQHAAPSARPGSVADAWQAFLKELGNKAPALADLMGRRAKLAHLDAHRAVVELQRLNDSERSMAFDKRNQRTLQAIWNQVVGDAVTLDLQDASQVADWKEDPFTTKVVERFEGRVEG
ncbi:MAG: DNA polymerase III subunit gamma/tau [Planctomycetes bacterium]|nr:DNA polymerase III subunit gamma/tau [Planctomycetota bacterium]MCB9910397.1 DNA polymerase III subunit gamma/tau [Planctomycetota bacterium]